MKRIIIACFVFLSFAYISPSHADTVDKKPTKESLLTAWEKVQKDSPYTVKFEKTAEKGVYTFQTTIFPYNGKIKVLNLLIAKKPAGYYDDYNSYSEAGQGDYIGIVELELENLPKNFLIEYRYSYETWDRDNALHFDAATSTWYTPRQWAEHQRVAKPAESCSSSGGGTQQDDKPSGFAVFLSWLPMLLLIGIWLAAIKLNARTQRKYYKLAEDNHKALLEILEVLKHKS